jgi:hypothetical protein
VTVAADATHVRLGEIIEVAGVELDVDKVDALDRAR